MAQIPLEIITEILLCLPVKTILRFRCVSKSLHTIIDGLDFINSHLSKSSKEITHRKLIYQDTSPSIGPTKRFYVFDMNNGLEEEIQFEKPFTSPSLWKHVYGNINGLLLLYGGSRQIALWNPSTRNYRILPDVPFRIPRNDSQFYRRIIGLGFGYDDSYNDYKVVFIVYMKTRIKLENQVWIFEVRSNIWRRIQDFPYLGYKVEKHPGIAGFGYFADGSLHWRCENNWEQEIVAFDMREETFSLMPQPLYSMRGVLANLDVLEGCLCISFLCSSTPTQSDLYIRRKDGDDHRFSWAKLYSVKEPVLVDTFRFTSVKVLGYLKKNRDKILLNFDMENIVLYDIEKESFGKVEIEKDPNWYDPIVCIESLL